MNSQTQQTFQNICRSNGWKCTAQRLAVFGFVNENGTHPGVDDVWLHIQKGLPTITRESVYRILNEFADHGILQRLDHLDSARYDSRTGPHGHFICERCGKISDFTLQENLTLPATRIVGKIRHVELRVSGVCNDCDKS